jgi:hypothetical protein
LAPLEFWLWMRRGLISYVCSLHAAWQFIKNKKNTKNDPGGRRRKFHKPEWHFQTRILSLKV